MQNYPQTVIWGQDQTEDTTHCAFKDINNGGGDWYQLKSDISSLWREAAWCCSAFWVSGWVRICLFECVGNRGFLGCSTISRTLSRWFATCFIKWKLQHAEYALWELVCLLLLHFPESLRVNKWLYENVTLPELRHNITMGSRHQISSVVFFYKIYSDLS